MHIVDAAGMVLQSDSMPTKNIDEILSHEDARHFMCCLKGTLATGKDICSYSKSNHDYLARMKKISSMRVRVQEWDITGIDDLKVVLGLV